MTITMTTQAKIVAAREAVFNFLESVDHRVENENAFLNSIDLMISDLAKDVIYGTVTLGKKEMSDKLNYLEAYGDPYSSIPPEALKVIQALRFITGQK